MSVVRAQARVVLVILATAAALLLVGGAQAQAATITVDVVGADEATDDDCLLAEALEAARTDAESGGCAAGSGDDVIVFDKAGTVPAPVGGFQIKSNVTIQGHSGGTTISGGGGVEVVLTKVGAAGAADTVGATEVKLADLTIMGAVAATGATPATSATGAGVTVRDDSDTVSLKDRYTVVLENLLVKGNAAEGIKFVKKFESARNGRVEVRDSVVEGNRKGGVSMKACRGSYSWTYMRVVNSSVRNNSSPAGEPDWSGGLTNLCGYLVIWESTISGNTGARAAVWANFGDWEDPADKSSRIAETTTVIHDSTIADNKLPRPKRSDNYGGGVHVSGRAGFEPQLSVWHATITRNEGDRDAASGIHLDDGVKGDIHNSAITGNHTVLPSGDKGPGTQCHLSGTGRRYIVGNASSSAACRGRSGISLTAEATLGPLADNGGAARIGPNGAGGHIETIAIDVDSGLFGTADAGHCQTRDARGVYRRQGRGCDIGAYEASVIEVDTLGGKADDGDCSLGEAIENANEDRAVNDDCGAGFGHDIISIGLPDDTTETPAETITAPVGGFQIASNMTIQGHSGGTTISGGGGVEVVLTKVGTAGAADTAGAARVRLADLTISGATGAGVTVTDDSDTAALTDRYDVTLENLLVKGNAAEGVKFVKKFESARPGAVSVKDSVVEGNRKGGVSMKACDASSDPVVLKVVNSSVSGNTSPTGESDWSGGVTNLCGRLEIRSSTISGNTGARAAVWAEFGDWEDPADKSSSRKATTTTVIVNSTIADNKLPRPKRSDNYGGAIHVSGRAGFRPILEVSHATITRNEGDRYTASGIHVDPGVRAGVYNTAIVGNKTILPSGDPTSGRQCRAFPGGRLSLHFTASSTEDCRNRVVQSESSLANLADNDGAVRIGPNGAGGHIKTIAIDADSALLGTADAGHCPSKDARGVSRPQGSRCDIGAYEADEQVIGDLVWEDRDGDGDQGDGEPGIGGVTLALVNSDDEVEATATTDSDGGYSFKVLSGEWTVRVTDDDGVLAGHPVPAAMSKTAVVSVGGADNLAFDFGYRWITIGDLVWEDRDGDGAQGDGEPGIGGVTLALVNSDDETAATATTDSDGGYSFKVTAGEWTVRVTDTAGVLTGHQPPAETSKTEDVSAGGADNLAFDFGYRWITIGDLVWEDRDGDGDQGDGEPGIGGVTLALVNSDDEVEATATTDSDGGYSFKVLSGEWTVRVTDDDGVLAGHPVPAAMSKTAVVSVGGAANLAFDFGYRWITIGDLVWEDRDGDGDQDDGEPGIENVTLALVDSGGVTRGTATTDSDGGYSFRVTAGEWTVRVTDTAGVLTGHQPPAETSKTEDVSAGGADNLGFDFGYAPLVTIGDLVWEDRDGDGAQGDGEPGIGGVTLALVNSDDETAATATTDSDGGYSFKVTAGEWTVRVTDTAGVLAGHPVPAAMSKTAVVSVGGADNLAFDFGYRWITIGDLVWEDRDGDGDQDDGEPGIENVTLALVDSAGVTRGTATTDSDGAYSFRVTAGEWTVRVTDTAGVLAGHQPPAETSKTEDVSAGGAANLAFDFGYRGSVEIGDLVWLDANGDGVQDAGEPGIEDVTLALVNSDDETAATATTDSDGAYGFFVTPGAWTVRVTQTGGALAGRRATTPSSLTLPVAAGGATASNFDFGYEPAAGASAEPVINVNTLAGDAVDGRCSLAEALEAAETDGTVDGCLAMSGDDTVNVSVPGVITAPDGGFQVESDVTIRGHAGGTTISGGVDVVVTKSESPGAAAATDVKLADLTLTGSSGSGVEVVDYANSSVATPYTVTLESLAVEASDRSGADAVRGRGVDVRAPLGSSRPGRVDIKKSVVKGSSYGVYVGSCDPRPADVEVTVTDSVIRDNTSGGVYNLCGDLRLVRSSVSGNSGSRAGVHSEYEGRPAAGGAPRTEIINTTVAGNTSSGLAGGVVVSQSGSAEPELSVKNSTIAGNTGLLVGGLHTMGSVAASVVNSVVADNTATVATDTGAQCRFGSAPPPDRKKNVSSDDSCGFGLVEDDLGLGELGDNGGAFQVGPNDGMGHVLTMAVASVSPLLSAGVESGCRDADVDRKDARGMPRPDTACDVGAYEAADFTIGGRVWLDADGAGDQDPGEGPIERVTMDLINSDGEVIDTEETNAEGEYRFRVLEGTWEVAVTDEHDVLTDYRAPSETSKTADVDADSDAKLGFDFGYWGPVEIGDKVWKDADHYGVQDAGEVAFGGVKVELLRGDGRGADSGVVADTVTNADGQYAFYVPEGTWTVRVAGSQGAPDPLNGYRATTAPSLTLPVAAGSGITDDYDFGYELLDPNTPRGRTINVNKLADGTDGLCSLAEAIEAANTDEAVDGCLAGSGDDSIVISEPGEIRAAKGFVIKSNVTVTGNEGGTTVRGSGFEVVVTDGDSPSAAAATKVTLAHLTITGVLNRAVSVKDAAGSALTTLYEVNLENLHVTTNVGVGIYFDRQFASGRPGTVNVKNSVIEDNRYGGIVLDACEPTLRSARLEVTNSIIRDNIGGIRNECGHIKVVDSTVFGNRFAGGVKAYGGYWQDRANSSGRRATTLTELVNTTISGNANSSESEGGGGVAVLGSGGFRPTLKIANSTITGNQAMVAAVGLYAQNPGNVSVSIANTVIADNKDYDGDDDDVDDQCSSGWMSTDFAGNASSDQSCGFSVVDKDVGSGLGELADNGGAAPIGPNGGGGNVRTRAIDATSPLFNAADAAACRDMFKEDDSDEEDSDEDEPEAARDARGVSRPQGSVCDIGAYEAMVVGGVVWDDKDGDLEREPGEEGLEGVSVNLVDPGGNVIETGKKTGSDGVYELAVKFVPGEWEVRVPDDDLILTGSGREVIPAQDAMFTVTSEGVSSTEGGALPTKLDVGCAVPVTIRVHVWEDDDGNGQQDEQTEVGLFGVGLELTRGTAEPVTKKTDEDGEYTHSGPPGQWRVEVTGGGGVSSDYVLDLDILTRMLLAGTASDFYFGYRHNIRIGGHVWEDTNRNGQLDDDEGRAGVTLKLLSGRGDAAVEVVGQTATTDSEGFYSFVDYHPNPLPGRWTVEVTDEADVLAAHDDARGRRESRTVSRSGANASAFDFPLTPAD